MPPVLQCVAPAGVVSSHLQRGGYLAEPIFSSERVECGRAIQLLRKNRQAFGSRKLMDLWADLIEGYLRARLKARVHRKTWGQA